MKNHLCTGRTAEKARRKALPRPPYGSVSFVLGYASRGAAVGVLACIGSVRRAGQLREAKAMLTGLRAAQCRAVFAPIP